MSRSSGCRCCPIEPTVIITGARAGEKPQASALLLPAATTTVRPCVLCRFAAAASAEVLPPPPRLMFTTAGVTWFAATQFMPAMIVDHGEPPLQPKTRTGWIVTALAMP